nr:hypothetical protein [Tanacetum cinerariifolium]
MRFTSSPYDIRSSLEARGFSTYLTLSFCSHRYHLCCHHHWLSFRARLFFQSDFRGVRERNRFKGLLMYHREIEE